MRKLIAAYCKKQGINAQSVRLFRFLFHGEPIDHDGTADSLDMEDTDVIDVMFQQTGCVAASNTAGFGLNPNSIGAELLGGQVPIDRATAADAGNLIRLLGGDGAGEWQSLPDEVLLDQPARAALIAAVDRHHRDAPAEGADIRLPLAKAELIAIVGDATYRQLVAVFAGRVDEIRIRRTEAAAAAATGFVEFHTDVSRRTLQVALNDDTEYTGGRLVFVTDAGFQIPRRPAGSVTVHSGRVLHGVTALTAGVRHGLFLCDMTGAVAAPIV